MSAEYCHCNPVDLEALLKDPMRYSQGITGKGIEINARLYFIAESGTLSPFIENVPRLRVHMKYGIRASEDKADEIMRKPLDQAKQVVVSGTVIEGFPGEYYLSVTNMDELGRR